MHQQVMEFLGRMKTRWPAAFGAGRVLECGAYNINGSPRGLFDQADEYVGLDWRPGPGVNVVGLAHEFRDPAGFDTLISTEMLEHDPHWRQSLANMARHVRPGGSLIVTCAGPERGPHEMDCAPEAGHYRGLSAVEVVQELRRAAEWDHIHAEQHTAVPGTARPSDTYVMCVGLLSERPEDPGGKGSPLPVPEIPGAVSVVVPAVGNVALTARCVEKARANAGLPCEIILVDNGSSPANAEALARLGADVYLRYDRMLGYPAACNRGIEISLCEYVCLLNNDAEIRTFPWGYELASLFRACPGVEIVAPVTDFVANLQQRASFDCGLADLRSECSDSDRVTPRHGRPAFEVERLFFVCVMMRRELFGRVGQLDESFGLGNSEDEEFCWRVRQAGGRLLVAPSVFVHHVGHATFGRLPQGMFESLLVRNRALFANKTGGR